MKKELNEKNLKEIFATENIDALYNIFVENRIAHMSEKEKEKAREEYWDEYCGTSDFIQDLKNKINEIFNLKL